MCGSWILRISWRQYNHGYLFYYGLNKAITSNSIAQVFSLFLFFQCSILLFISKQNISHFYVTYYCSMTLFPTPFSLMETHFISSYLFPKKKHMMHGGHDMFLQQLQGKAITMQEYPLLDDAKTSQSYSKGKNYIFLFFTRKATRLKWVK